MASGVWFRSGASVLSSSDSIRQHVRGGQCDPFVLPDTGTIDDFRLPVPKGTTVRAHVPASQAKPCYLAGYSKLIRT